MKTQNAFSELILDINTAARHPAEWSAVLEKIAAAVNATKASMHRHQFSNRRHTAGARVYSFGYEKAAADIYAKHFARHDPYVHRIRDRHKGLSAGTSDELLTSSDLRRTNFYAHYARPNEIFHVSWITFEVNERFVSGLAMIRPEDAVQFTPKHVTFLRSLAPHLEHAFDLQRFIEHLIDRDDLLQTSVDQANVALLALAEDGRIINMSQSAETLLEMRDPLRLRQGRIQAIDPVQDDHLQRLFASAACTWLNTPNPRGNTLRMARKDGRTWLLVKVFAYSAGIRREYYSNSLFGEDRPSVLVLLFDPLARRGIQQEALRLRLGLNPTEARIAMALGDNYRQKEIAQRLGLSDGNVRQCLHNIYRKTGATGQVALMQMLSTVSAEL